MSRAARMAERARWREQSSPTYGYSRPFNNDARPEGRCPRGTPGCKYADCSPSAGHSCHGPDAPPHVDMLGGPGDRLEGTDIEWPLSGHKCTVRR